MVLIRDDNAKNSATNGQNQIPFYFSVKTEIDIPCNKNLQIFPIPGHIFLDYLKVFHRNKEGC